jgi:putative ABC transport system permease protein
MKGLDIILQLSIRSIRLNFLRSVLAALGIVIGVVAIASMGMMGANMTLSVTDQLSSMANILTVTPYSGGGQGGGMMPGGGGSSSDDEEYITEKQFEKIENVAGKYGTVYALRSSSDTFFVGGEEGRATIYGLDPEVIKEILTVDEGEYPQSTTGVLVGPTLAERYEIVIGSRITIGDEDEVQQTVRVVGILEERGMSFDLSTDNAIVVVDELYTGLYGEEGEYGQVNVILTDINDANVTKEAITDQLNKKEDTVTVSDSSRMLDSVTETLGTMTTFVMAIAGISLMVAATSIFNVMMMSVKERIREIGILRSIGTQKWEILRMFIYESIILGIVGAVIGAVMSLAIGYLVVLVMVGSTDYLFELGSIGYIPVAMFVGLCVCILSGVYPAWKASNLDPIEALRAE